jgi:hypothetical protein
MSQAQEQSALPPVEQAQRLLFSNLDNEVFFRKLAGAGVVPQTQKSAEALLELGHKLQNAEALQQKTASAENDPYIAANQALDRVLQANGLGAAIKTAGAHEDLALADAVQHLAQNDDLYNAALSLKVAEAEEIERWLQSQPLA